MHNGRGDSVYWGPPGVLTMRAPHANCYPSDKYSHYSVKLPYTPWAVQKRATLS